MKQYDNKVVVITGGTAGIGRATALAFAAAGAKVVITGRREKEGQEVVDEITKGDGEALFIKTDVAQEVEVKAMIDQTVAAYGRLDFAFNNAGVEQALKPLPEQTEEEFDFVTNINIKGVWLSMKYEIPALLQSGGGAIVNMSSIGGLVAAPGMDIYVASKHAVIGLTKSAALAYAKRNIRINVVSPGAIATAMFQRIETDNPAAGAAIKAAHPMGRAGTSEEIASAVLWLCSAGASFVTGQTLAIDGGYTAQ
ncbi:MAG: SDR family oxidoreductase [Acidobacteria bacterium]|nr:SDR family oxidoreductase [Acidobacteriota bacterium]